MYDVPHTLQNLCLNFICDNLLFYIEPDSEHMVVSLKKLKRDSSLDENMGKFKFKDSNIFLIAEVSERLLEKLCEKKLLTNSTLHIFTEHNTKLTKFIIENCKVSKEGLMVLKHHKISHIECINMEKISIGDILDCLSDWSMQNLTHVNFSQCTFIDESRYSFMVKLTNFKNIRSLNLSFTELNQSTFKILCEDLKQLENLNISGTYVTDLSPLLHLSNKLKSLSISHIYIIEYMYPVIEKLVALKCLDMSFIYHKIDNIDMYIEIVELLKDPKALPSLRYLDLSGWRELIPSETFLQIIRSHPKLEFLGFVMSSVTLDDVFSDQSKADYPHNLVIAGLGNEDQIIVTLRKYQDRSSYIQKALYHLFQLTAKFQEPRPDIFHLILPVMELHSNKFGVQIAATACIYNLTRGELSKRIHPNILSKAVELILNAMEKFPEEFQLHKNALLTLCSDRILQDIQFDRFMCAKLVLNFLCSFDDVNTDRMGVAICSILAAKVSTDETSQLGAKPEYMHKLLNMVKQRIDLSQADITLKFTLSALWNLTDESAATCSVFLDQQGVQMFLRVLSVFQGNSAIETKVLGLLNNIAEVPNLRPAMALTELAPVLYTLLQSDNIDVSYFAAGIVAHLASDGEKSWNASSRSREELLVELKNAVDSWKVPDIEMVAYRSFRPFFPLLAEDMDYRIQLWAVWAVHHVCTKNPKRYCEMLMDERGHVLLRNLVSHKDTHPNIAKYCSLILQTFESNVRTY